MKSHVQRLYQHMVWADAQILECLRAAPDPRSLRLFGHLLAAEQVWLARLREQDSSARPIWPELSLAECAALAQQNQAEYALYLDQLPETALTSTVTYRNSRGEGFTTSVLDILTHIALHGSYHRGQVAAAVHASGAEPINTDFVAFVREERSVLPLRA